MTRKSTHQGRLDLRPQEQHSGPNGIAQPDRVAAELGRIDMEYKRRARDIDSDLYALWQPGQILMRNDRLRLAATMLHRAGVFPMAGDQCLEIGFGSLGWLGELICWGVCETDLHGIELSPIRVDRARSILPAADLRVGDASALPWACDSFHLVIASTVFTSILDSHVRRLVADEIMRVLAPGGALLWYDFAVNNPNNPHVRKVRRTELKKLFTGLQGCIESVTLAPPLARRIAARSGVLATLATAMPLLRTHLMAVLQKPGTRHHSNSVSS